ncbi:pyridoxamine 5'-phosphate oxidase family protein [Luteipulveratus halotolerans]|uniref:Pyridoxamine 5'-phosphate oxidase N-terminal domain-containing protein n=1 Tax=Luteipulveratus halotolerans TaxID=1631356 RepID=A0A0L6CF85_9MICO|nr:pyridoxamine 5'-phosphate oxidase family protein [Luteipulveratus halotolerans]KNX36447.1 hypothetical protein VV01_03645 [Luteipulveratus halotolerans]
MPLTLAERQEFLTQPHTATISVQALRTGRGPLAVPIWYDVDAEGRPWILTDAGSVKARHIEAAGSFTLTAHQLTPSVRYVSVEGPVQASRAAADADLVGMTERYLTGDAVAAYLDFARPGLSTLQVITMEPQHWLSGDLGSW